MDMSRHDYNIEVHNALTRLGWHGRLNGAACAEDVVAIVRDHLAQWTPAELAHVPEALRPGKFVDAEDVADYAIALAQAQVGRAPDDTGAVHKLAMFFSDASARLAQILARTPETADDANGLGSYGR